VDYNSGFKACAHIDNIFNNALGSKAYLDLWAYAQDRKQESLSAQEKEDRT